MANRLLVQVSFESREATSRLALRLGFNVLVCASYVVMLAKGPDGSPLLLILPALWGIGFARNAIHAFFAFAGSGLHVFLGTWASFLLFGTFVGIALGWLIAPFAVAIDILALRRNAVERRS